jgi:hypothetical protein
MGSEIPANMQVFHTLSTAIACHYMEIGAIV